MEFKKILTVCALSTSVLLTACGSDDETTAAVGVEYTGKTADLALTDEGRDEVSIEMQAALKAVTFVSYQADTADYKMKYESSIIFSNVMRDILTAAALELEGYFGSDPIPATPVAGDCETAGVATVSGSTSNLSVSANAYCVEVDGAEVTLSGAYNFVVDGQDYSIGLNNSTVLIDFYDPDLTDINMTADGAINYAVSELETVLSVNTEITFDGMTTSSNVTQTCTFANESCVADASVLSENGSTYRVEDLSVSSSNGYNGSAEFYLPGLGKVSADFSHIQYCEDGSIGKGSIDISSSTGPAEIEMYFPGCDVDVYVAFHAEGDLY